MPPPIGATISDEEFQKMAGGSSSHPIGATISDEEFQKLAAPQENVSVKLDYGEPKESSFYSKAAPYVRPLLEGAGMTAGATVGAPTALISGPMGPIAGAGIGFAGGKAVADLLDKILGDKEPESVGQMAANVPTDIATGSAYEMGGQAAGKALGGAYQAAKGFLRGNLPQRAGEELVRATTPGSQYAKNAEEAAAIEKEIGTQFTRGEARNDPRAIMAERSLARGGDAAGAMAEHRAAVNDALRKYYGKNFSEGEVDQVIQFLQSEQAKLGQGVESARGGAAAAAQAIQGQGPQESGQAIVQALKGGRAAAKSQAAELYNQVGNPPVNVENLKGQIPGIARPTSEFEELGNVPSILSKIKNYFTPPAEGAPSAILDEGGLPFKRPAQQEITEMPFQDLRGLRTTVLNDIRNEAASASPNAPKLNRLRQLKDSIEQTIDQLGQGEGPTTEAYRKASKFYREEYAQKFKQGAVADVLKPGMRGEETRIPSADIAGRFFKSGKLDAADQFIKAVGGNAEARQAIKDYAANDLLKTATDPQTGEIISRKLFNWNAKNARVLGKFGLRDSFSNVSKAQAALEEAKGAVAEFESSSAAKMLKAEPGKAIESAFAGSASNPAAVATDLMNRVKGNFEAKKGLQKAFGDFLIKKMETTASDVAGNTVLSVASSKKLIGQYAGAMRVLYADQPSKIKALMTIQKAIDISGRSAKSPLGGGSDTAENIMNSIGNLVKDKALNFSVWTRALKAGKELLSGYNEGQIKKYLTRSLVDPQYAQSLIDLAKGFQPAKAKVASLFDNLGSLAPATIGDQPTKWLGSTAQEVH